MLPENDFVDKKVNKKLEEAYEHIKPYMKEDPLLKELCAQCEKYNGQEHNYEECRNKVCFDIYLAAVYLRWVTAWE